MPRPPKPEKQIEYTLTVKNSVVEETGAVLTAFEIRTTREFESFQYVLKVETTIDESAHVITMNIGGVSVPADLMPGAGPAIGGHTFRDLTPGEYTLVVTKPPKSSNTFAVQASKTVIAVESRTAEEDVFIRLA